MRRKLIRVLSQRSTVVGLVGVMAAVLSLLELPISAETELKAVEGVLLLVSFIAIMTREEEPYHGVDRRSSDSTGSNVCSNDCDRGKAGKGKGQGG